MKRRSVLKTITLAVAALFGHKAIIASEEKYTKWVPEGFTFSHTFRMQDGIYEMYTREGYVDNMAFMSSHDFKAYLSVEPIKIIQRHAMRVDGKKIHVPGNVVTGQRIMAVDFNEQANDFALYGHSKQIPQLVIT